MNYWDYIWEILISLLVIIFLFVFMDDKMKKTNIRSTFSYILSRVLFTLISTLYIIFLNYINARYLITISFPLLSFFCGMIFYDEKFSLKLFFSSCYSAILFASDCIAAFLPNIFFKTLVTDLLIV